MDVDLTHCLQSFASWNGIRLQLLDYQVLNLFSRASYTLWLFSEGACSALRLRNSFQIKVLPDNFVHFSVGPFSKYADNRVFVPALSRLTRLFFQVDDAWIIFVRKWRDYWYFIKSRWSSITIMTTSKVDLDALRLVIFDLQVAVQRVDRRP